MTITRTTNFGLIATYNEALSANDWAVPYWNWLFADEILYVAAVTHRHNGQLGIQAPTGDLQLSTGSSGGYLPANTTYYFPVTYIDNLLRETSVSKTASITTAAGISAPDTPTINKDATPTDIQPCPGGLSGGEYWYKISYAKNGGESLPSAPVYVFIPYDNTYECTIHFKSLDEVANGADAIFVYRKIGASGRYVKLAEITAGSIDYYTDDNTGIPNCDKAPVVSSTINAGNTITIDWSELDYTKASKIRIYASTLSGVYHDKSLVAEVTMDNTTPVTSYFWNGTARTMGRPPEISHCYPGPSKINLEEEVEGKLPWDNITSMTWGNLPVDFTWGKPVTDYASLPIGIEGEVRVVLDEDALYVWDAGLSTPAWIQVSSGESGGGYYGTYITYEALASEIPSYGDGAVAFVKNEEKFFYYDTEAATPAWVEVPSQSSTGSVSEQNQIISSATPIQDFTIFLESSLITKVVIVATDNSATPAYDYDFEIYEDSDRTILAYQLQNVTITPLIDALPWEWFGATTMYCRVINNSVNDIDDFDITIYYRR